MPSLHILAITRSRNRNLSRMCRWCSRRLHADDARELLALLEEGRGVPMAGQPCDRSSGHLRLSVPADHVRRGRRAGAADAAGGGARRRNVRRLTARARRRHHLRRRAPLPVRLRISACAPLTLNVSSVLYWKLVLS